MKKRYLTVNVFLMCLTLILTGCFGDDSGDKKIGAGEEVITATKIVYSADHGGTTDESFVYFSFKNGELAATSAATDDWDLRFGASRYIHSNGGATATNLASSGQGLMAYTGSTNFSAAVDLAALTFTADYEVYAESHASGAQVMNILCFPGYATGDGTLGNPYTTANNTAEAYYIVAGMPPAYTMTEGVYVVKLGDGSGYAKLQIKSMEYATQSNTPDTGDKTTTYNFLVKYQLL